MFCGARIGLGRLGLHDKLSVLKLEFAFHFLFFCILDG